MTWTEAVAVLIGLCLVRLTIIDIRALRRHWRDRKARDRLEEALDEADDYLRSHGP